MHTKWNYLFAALGFGTLIPLQAVINNRLAKTLTHPLQASLISFWIGFISLLLVFCLLKIPLPTLTEIRSNPPLLFVGGFIGAIFVSAFLYIIPQIGAASHVLMTVTGQVLISLLMDHYGFFGLPIHQLSWQRLMGCLLVILGVSLAHFS